MPSTFENAPDLQAGWSSFSNGMFHEAYHALHRHLTHSPECGYGWELIGRIYHAWSLWGPALAALEEASVRIPMSPMGECALADCYRITSKFRWAEDLYRQLIYRKGATVPALLRAASGLDAMSESRRAVVACRRAIKLDSTAAQPHFDLAYYLTRCGSSVWRVEASARRAIELAPENLTFRVGLAGFLHSQSRVFDGVQLLAELTIEHVQLMRCRCCLTRLIALFEAAEDEERAQWCRTRQAMLHFTESD